MSVSPHTHSWHSLLEAEPSPAALVQRAVEAGYSAVALTDTNSLCGAVTFVDLAARAGLRPIVGAHLRHAGCQAVALVADHTGYRNLCRILSRIHLDEPGTASLTELLASHADGLHVLIADVRLATALREVFRDRLWLEIVRPGPRVARYWTSEATSRTSAGGGSRSSSATPIFWRTHAK